MSDAPERLFIHPAGLPDVEYIRADLHAAIVEKYKALVAWADTQMGTPCEQIRHAAALSQARREAREEALRECWGIARMYRYRRGEAVERGIRALCDPKGDTKP